ncbi:WD40 repeat domain-containing protein [[Scytonema hofmanni] UTEX B 1581]|uniref:WD40 repeat domain-containing protein n=1 Tax=[Scytonema hofmanni] UTEX B 1581 TaxID=379535 RepID=UPI000495AAAE|nr:WD40 repeat domain-containing protein [[Scytonema hofmanni] UTEX B 1581]
MGELATKFASATDEVKNLFLGKRAESNLKAGDAEKYYQTLTNFDFISLKIQYPKFGVEALIRDYYLIHDPEILDKLEEEEKLDPEQVKTLKLIQRTLELSAHVLNQDPNQLVGQLWGRLQSFPQPEIQKILADAQQSKSEIPRFRPITASLTTPSGNLLRTLTGHNSTVRAVAIAPDGKTAVSASSDKTLKLWDLEKGLEISTLTGHNDWVTAVAIAPDGKTAVSASSDKTLKLWDLEKGKEIEEIKKNPFKYAIYIFRKRFKLLKRKEISTLTGHNSTVTAVAIAPNGKTAVSASNDNTLKLWDLEKGLEISTFIGDSSITCCAVSPDGLTIVAGEQLSRVHFLRLEGGSENE